MRRKDAAADLAVQLVQTLETQRICVPDGYPLRLEQLAEQLDPRPTSELILKATGKPPVKERVLLPKKQMDAPVALVEDIEQFANSDQLLLFAISLACTPARPTIAVASLAGKLDKRLKEPFVAALGQRIQEKCLPDGIEVLRVGRADHLHPLHLPLPAKPEVEFAQRMLAVLGAREAQADFLSLEQLVSLTGVTPKPAIINKALAEKSFRDQVLVPLPKLKIAPVARRQERERLFASPALLHLLLQMHRKQTEQVIGVKKLARKLPKEERSDFLDAVNRALDADKQPAGLGWLWSGNQRCLLLLSDVHGKQAPASQTSAAGEDFLMLFDRAFGTLDRQNGEHNFVKLTELRLAIPVARGVFDAGLRELRRKGRYSLSAAEGRHGLAADDREAAIVEDGSLLLYVSKRDT